MTTETYTPDQCEALFHVALAAGDARGVEAALIAMAPQDPHRAQRLLDNLRTAMTIAADLAARITATLTGEDHPQ